MKTSTLEYKEALNLILNKVEHRIANDEVILECPYCGGKDKMYLNKSKYIFNCFKAGCHASGHINKLLETLGIEGRCKIEPLKQDAEKDVHFSFPELIDINQSKKAVDYMLSRGISANVATSNGVMFCPTKHSLAFTTKNPSGKIVSIEYRNTDKKQIFFEPHSSIAYLRHKESVVNRDRLYITEGSMDALTLAEIGIKNVCSIPNGASSDAWIEGDWDFLKTFKEIVLCYDNDDVGRKALERVKKRLGFARLFTVDIGNNKDLNEAFMNNPKMTIECASDPIRLPLDSIINLEDISLSDDPQAETFSCGIGYIDEMFGGFRPNETTLLVAPSGTGKSTILSNLISGFIGQEQKVALYSGELSNRGVKNWLYTTLAGTKKIKYIQNKFRPKDKIAVIPKAVESAIDKALSGKFFLYDANNNNAYQIIDRFKELHDRHGVNVFMLDNLSIVDMAKKGLGQWEAQEEFSKKITEFVRNNKVTLICVTHPTKENINNEVDFVDKKGNVKPLQKWTQTNVKGSASLSNLAHNIMFASRAGEHETAYISQVATKKCEKDGIDPSSIVDTIKSELALIMYLVKNRENGNMYETKLFGYMPSERKIYSLFKRDDDIHFSISKDIESTGIDCDKFL